MNELIIPLVQNLQVIVAKGGYTILALGTLIEGLPMIGTAVPGQSMVVLAGFLAHAGYFKLPYIVALVTVCSMVGDIVGYILGRKVGLQFISLVKRYFFVTDAHIAKTEAIIRKHSGKAIIFARYNPITRSLIPFFAGVTNVPHKLFWPYDFIGATLWSLVMVFGGYLFGASYQAIGTYIGSAIAATVTAAGLFIWGYRYVNTRKHIFDAYHALALIISVISIVVFGVIIQDAFSSHTVLARADAQIALWVLHNSQYNYWQMVTYIASVCTLILSPVVFASGALILAGYQLIRLKFKKMFFIVMSMGGGLLLNTSFKLLVERERPFEAYVPLSDYSFPSGHAMAATLFFGILIVVYVRKIKNRYVRDSFVIACIGAAIFSGSLRVILNVHWLSDVIGAFALGTCWVALMILATRIISSGASWRS